MKKQSLVLGLILGGCVAAVACRSDGDDSSPSNTGGSGGGGGKSGSGGTHAGGTTSGGAAAGGSAGKAGTGNGTTAGASEGGEAGAPVTSEGGAGGEAGGPVGVVPPPLPLDPYTVVVTSATPATFNHVLVTATDYATKGEVASVKLSPATIEDSTSYPDKKGDVIAVGSGGLGFVLQRTEDKVNLVDGSKIKTTFDIANPGTNAAVDIANKAYVPVYNYNFISVLDLNVGTVAARIDLAQFNDPTDSDGSVNTTAAMYDPAKKVAYFVLSRIDLGSFDSNFNLPCSATRALVVGVDAVTDAIVDLNGDADGKALELYLSNPSSAHLSADGKTITVFDSGCFAGGLARQGVEQLHLDTLSRTVAYAPTDSNPPGDLILLAGQQALLHSYLPYDPNAPLDAPTDVWNKLDLGTGVLGVKLNNVPTGAAFDGTSVIGVTIDPVSQAANVVRYDIASDTNTTVVSSPWVGKYSSAATVALVK